MITNTSLINVIDPGETIALHSGVEVTAFDANHVPGAICLLFKQKTDTKTLTVFYTGDFRWQADKFSDLLETVRDFPISTIYLDNSYFNSKCTFPSREEVQEELLRIVDEYPDSVIYIGISGNLGKETVIETLAQHVGEFITVPTKRYANMCSLNCANVVQPEEYNNRIQVISLKKLNPSVLAQKHFTTSSSSPLVFIALSALPLIPSYQNFLHTERPHFYYLPYSDHSSYDELINCIHTLRPATIQPIIPIVRGSDPARILPQFLSESTPCQGSAENNPQPLAPCSVNLHNSANLKKKPSHLRPKLKRKLPAAVTFLHEEEEEEQPPQKVQTLVSSLMADSTFPDKGATINNNNLLSENKESLTPAQCDRVMDVPLDKQFKDPNGSQCTQRFRTMSLHADKHNCLDLSRVPDPLSEISVFCRELQMEGCHHASLASNNSFESTCPKLSQSLPVYGFERRTSTPIKFHCIVPQNGSNPHETQADGQHGLDVIKKNCGEANSNDKRVQLNLSPIRASQKASQNLFGYGFLEQNLLDGTDSQNPPIPNGQLQNLSDNESCSLLNEQVPQPSNDQPNGQLQNLSDSESCSLLNERIAKSSNNQPNGQLQNLSDNESYSLLNERIPKSSNDQPNGQLQNLSDNESHALLNERVPQPSKDQHFCLPVLLQSQAPRTRSQLPRRHELVPITNKSQKHCANIISMFLASCEH